MARPSEGPKCPTPEEVADLVDLLNELISDEENVESDEYQQKVAKPRIVQLQRAIEVLDWAGEQVNKRRLYSKKFQLKDKERTRILKERLGEDYDTIIEQAKSRAADKLFEEVANGAPDADDIKALTNNAE